MNKYRVHFFVFFLALFISLTLAHPAILLNDEFITTNQLRQLHDGHQIVINEGKYGLLKNGSMSGYFAYKTNALAYPLFLPLLSLPVYWIIDLSGEHFVFFILIIWTVTALVLTLFIHHFFTKFSYCGKWQWTPLMIGVIFVFFYINLFFYASFPVDDRFSNFPEIIAIVFTNIILLSLSAVMIYEINRTIFEDPAFSFFGTLVCLFSSSCFLWVTFCKDHTLVLAVFTAIFLCLVRFLKTDEYWYLPLAFLLCGTLAWIRPELALWIVLLVCGICGYTLLRYQYQKKPEYCLSAIICSPLFTIFGALPFFLNNYFITKNFFLPPQSVYLPDTVEALTVNMSHSLSPFSGVKTPQAFTMFIPVMPVSPVDTFVDLLRIFFYPQNGSISVFAIVPLAFVMIVLAGVLLTWNKIHFSSEEKKFIILTLLMSSAVFFTYFNLIHFLNTDPGQAPDVRYLIPIYTPLIILGLIILKKTDILPFDTADTIRQIFVIGIVGLALTVFFLPTFYLEGFFTSMASLPIGKFFSLYVFSLIILTFGAIFCSILLKWRKEIARYLIFLICLIPFFWQVNVIITFSKFSLYTGYIYWIPIMNEFWKLILMFNGMFR